MSAFGADLQPVIRNTTLIHKCCYKVASDAFVYEQCGHSPRALSLPSRRLQAKNSSEVVIPGSISSSAGS